MNLGTGSGILELMDDLGAAMVSNDSDLCMLGGGQPAFIPEMEALWKEQMERIISEPSQLNAVLSKYEPPQGNTEFLITVAEQLKSRYGWNVSMENVAVTSGGQSAFFMLFNSLAGQNKEGLQKKILLPLVPEYIGYSDLSVGSPMFDARKPKITLIGEHRYKYRIDFDNLRVGREHAAVCLSSPTNPSGNVITDEEMDRLRGICQKAEIPLIIDNAYGAPFPNIFFKDITPVWDEGMILTMSLSKIGLPGTRTGIVVAHSNIIRSIASMTCNMGLANNNLGQALTLPLIKGGRLFESSDLIVKPFYERKSREALEAAKRHFPDDLPYRIHESDGALFHWYWFPDLPISTQELYERLKAKNVLIIPGKHFFFGLSEKDESWPHREECIRVSFAMDSEVVDRGLRIIAEEVMEVYGLR